MASAQVLAVPGSRRFDGVRLRGLSIDRLPFPQEWCDSRLVDTRLLCGGDGYGCRGGPGLRPLFHQKGITVLLMACLVSSLAAPLALWGGFSLAMLGMALWGVGLGAQKAILKAAIVGMVPSERRGTAYGLYNAAYGVSWFLGSSLMGWLYGPSPAALAGLSVTAELAAVPLILLVAHMQVAANAAIAAGLKEGKREKGTSLISTVREGNQPQGHARKRLERAAYVLRGVCASRGQTKSGNRRPRRYEFLDRATSKPACPQCSPNGNGRAWQSTGGMLGWKSNEKQYYDHPFTPKYRKLDPGRRP